MSPHTDAGALLKLAIQHIDHMAAWISAQNAGYSFESLGEDMPSIRQAASQGNAGGEAEPEAEGLGELLARVRNGSIDAEHDIIEMFNFRRKELKACLAVLSPPVKTGGEDVT